MNIIYDLVHASEVVDAHKIEISSFPSEEAATLEKFIYRQAQAPDLFLGAFDVADNKRQLIGYVCSTLSSSPTLTHESMEKHDPAGTSVCIHAVCVSPEHRRKGIALSLLKEYVARLEAASRGGALYERILLITHEQLRPLYERAGFEWLGPSAVVHGPDPWYEMRRLLISSSEAPSVPPGLWEALQRASTRPGTSAKLLSTFANGLSDVTDSGSPATNKFDLLCPRDGCGSVILKNGVATLEERESVQLEPQGSRTILAALPSPPSKLHWWRVTPNAMAFENIGFSKAVVRESDGKRLKLLSCAECDLGPLGWCEEGGSEFWLPTTRVGYRA